MRAALYARKSTDDTLGASVARQIDHARRYSERQGWTVSTDHVYGDDGISGAEFVQRPGLIRLLQAATSLPRPFDVVVMADADRIGRLGPRSALAFLELHEAGIRVFHYLTDEEQRLESAVDRMS